MADDKLTAIVEMAREAGRLAQDMRNSPDVLDTRLKGPMDLVTAADHAVEALLRDRIATLEPGVAILGEEGGLVGSGARTWILDPIDGTVNFARGTPNWAISIGVFDGKDLTHGVIHAPDLGLTASARKGQGCFVNGKRVLFDDAPGQSLIAALGYSPRMSLQSYYGLIGRLMEAGIEHRRYGAATICFMGLLSGWFDAFHEGALNIWDAAAGLILVREAGGTVSHAPFDEFLAGPSEVSACNSRFPCSILGAD